MKPKYKRVILKESAGRVRWKCEFCLAKLSCAKEDCGAESICPHCENETLYPSISELEKERARKRYNLMIFVVSALVWIGAIWLLTTEGRADKAHWATAGAIVFYFMLRK